MIAAGVLWTIAWLRSPMSSPLPPLMPAPLSWACGIAGGIWPALMAHLMLAFPTGRLGRTLPRIVVAAAYLESVLVAAAELSWTDLNHPPGWFAALLLDTSNMVVAVLGLAVLGLLIVMWRRSTVTERRVITFVLGASIAATLLYVLWAQVVKTGLWPLEIGLAVRLAMGAIPLAYLATLVRNRIDRGGVADLMVRLNGSAVPDNLPQALADALHDPTLVVGLWLPEQQCYADREGREVPLPSADSRRRVTRVDREGTPVAVLIHDPALLHMPELVDAACAAAALALENERLAAELRRRLDQLASSRGRLVHAVAVERRRLERDLHDGVQQRLLSAAMTLGLAEATSTDGRLLVAEAKATVLTALDELRALCDGIHPPVLTERGLPGAVREMTAVASVPTELNIQLPQAPPPEIETVAYYVVAEALTNIGKHATATRSSVSIGLRSGSLVVEVGDDGCGGADPTGGSGLSGLAERVEANGGTLAVISPAGRGTTIRAVLPCVS